MKEISIITERQIKERKRLFTASRYAAYLTLLLALAPQFLTRVENGKDMERIFESSFNSVQVNTQPEVVGEDSFTLLTSKEGLPSMVLVNDKVVLVDRDTARIAREKALAEKSYQLVDVISSDTKIDKIPLVENIQQIEQEIPEDTLTDEELARKGVKIIQADYTRLHIRKSAFEKGGVLEDLASGNKRMLIVLLDGCGFFDKLASGQRYEEIKKILPEFPSSVLEKYRQEKIDEYTKKASEELKKVSEGRGSELDEKALLTNKIFSFIFENSVLTEKELLENLYSSDLGKYFHLIPDFLNDFIYNGKYYQEADLKEGRSLVLLSTSAPKTKNLFGIYYNPDGELKTIQVDYSFGKPFLDSAIDEITLSYPKDYDDPNNYMPLICLHHEVGHHVDEVRHGGLGIPFFMERSADKIARRNIERAWKKFVESGFKDNSLYPFVFELPGQGFIIGEKLNLKALSC